MRKWVSFLDVFYWRRIIFPVSVALRGTVNEDGRNVFFILGIEIKHILSLLLSLRWDLLQRHYAFVYRLWYERFILLGSWV